MENDNSFFSDVNNIKTSNINVNAFDKNYSKHYSEDGIWNKIKKHYKSIGKKFIKLVLVLYYTLRDDDTPKWAKAIILGALGYFILPLDIIPDFVPVMGFADDLVSITLAISSVILHIKEEHKEKADKMLEALKIDANV
ncbi:MAG: YkvA family protein [Bacteroidetes bacterium]|nr:YkvA family protein [Bacteroidota bacterium]